MAGPVRFYFEDIVLHGVLDTPAMTITETHVSLYAGLSHDFPVADGRQVPELLPLCLTPGLGWRVSQPPLAVLAFMGFDWEVLHPVRVGDTIHSRSRTAVKRSLREGGVVIEERQVINQHGTVVQKGRFTFLVAKRPPSS
jgi:acyl dehydratase